MYPRPSKNADTPTLDLEILPLDVSEAEGVGLYTLPPRKYGLPSVKDNSGIRYYIP